MKKTLFAFVIVMMLVLMMVGCSKKQDSTPAAGTYDIVFWHHEAPDHRVAAFDRLIAAFTATRPNVRMRQEIVGWGEATSKLFAAVEANQAPDFQFGIPDLMITCYNADIILPVTDVVNEVNAQYKIYPDILGMYNYKNEYWGLPVATMPFALSYRPSILKQFGYNQPPTTWSEMLSMARDITNRGKGDVYGIGLGGGRNLFVDEQAYMFLASRGARFFNEDGSIAFNSPETVDMLRYYKELYQYSPIGSDAWMWGEIEMNLAAGVCAMAPYLPSIQIRMNDLNSDDLAFTQMPLYQAGAKPGSLTYPNDIVVFKQSKERGNFEIVKEFMKFMMQPEININFTSGMEPGGFIPCTEAAAAYSGYWNSPIIQRYLAVNKEAVATLDYASLYGFEYGHWVNNGIGDIVGANVLSATLSKVLTNELTPEAAAVWGAAEMEKLSKPLR